MIGSLTSNIIRRLLGPDLGAARPVNVSAVRTIDWVDGAIELIDQTLLPDKCVTLRVHTVDELVDAIRRLAVRGAPALGVAGALGVVLADGDQELIARLRAARPTAVNLAWGVDRAAARLGEGREAVLAAALRLRDDDIAACRAMGERGADLLEGDRLRIMTVCNTGALAAVEHAPRSASSVRCTSAAGWPRSSRWRPGRCSRGPGSPPGSWPGWARRTASSPTRRGPTCWPGAGWTRC
ncbi:Initiation factor 2 subunit family protein [Nonomuraea wenchangensis]|uniref:Initiation factor 2 subunit family protein n=1 Tax=Nonomuraea wenchangensis TaxID=568860 RepID=A0A1I0K4M5_9ACTN|nr:Initiation factor 2 subunit family protein [Nonomuraea wenchangensis]